MDDHWCAWRQTHEAGGAPRPGSGSRSDGPFSFCSFPFLLSPRAKSRLLHTEARFRMAQTVQQVRACSALPSLTLPHTGTVVQVVPVQSVAQYGCVGEADLGRVRTAAFPT